MLPSLKTNPRRGTKGRQIPKSDTNKVNLTQAANKYQETANLIPAKISWLANVVMVKKSSGKWQFLTFFTHDILSFFIKVQIHKWQFLNNLIQMAFTSFILIT
jgi:hypothetical protein